MLPGQLSNPLVCAEEPVARADYDASVMPSVTGGDSNAPSIMIGERCADVVLGTEGRR